MENIFSGTLLVFWAIGIALVGYWYIVRAARSAKNESPNSNRSTLPIRQSKFTPEIVGGKKIATDTSYPQETKIHGNQAVPPPLTGKAWHQKQWVPCKIITVFNNGNYMIDINSKLIRKKAQYVQLDKQKV